jgi:hypothetical protein
MSVPQKEGHHFVDKSSIVEAELKIFAGFAAGGVSATHPNNRDAVYAIGLNQKSVQSMNPCFRLLRKQRQRMNLQLDSGTWIDPRV